MRSERRQMRKKDDPPYPAVGPLIYFAWHQDQAVIEPLISGSPAFLRLDPTADVHESMYSGRRWQVEYVEAWEKKPGTRHAAGRKKGGVIARLSHWDQRTRRDVCCCIP